MYYKLVFEKGSFTTFFSPPNHDNARLWYMLNSKASKSLNSRHQRNFSKLQSKNRQKEQVKYGHVSCHDDLLGT
jgi:hypothetical protein